MKKNLFLFLLFAIAICINAQVNLVPNPSFDQTVSCPTGLTLWNSCASWNNVNMMSPNSNACNGVYGTPDFFHSCGWGGANMPSTNYGQIQSNSGPGMMGLIVYNGYYSDYREYISAKLNCQMLSGVTYSISLMATRSTYSANVSVQHIGVVLSAGPLSQSCASLINNQTPQYETTSNNFIGTNSWTPLSFTYTPSSNLKYITIGNFRNDGMSNTITTNSTVTPQWAKYFFDDISIVPIININTVITQPNCMNPCGSASLIPTNTLVNYIYNWIPGNYTTSSVPCLTPGTYTVNVSLDSYCNSTAKTITFTINPPPIPIVSISSPAPPYCQGSCVNLIATGASNYTWLPTNTNGNSTWVCPNAPTTYSLIGINSYSCTSMTTINISPIPSPNITISAQPSPLCVGTNATLTAFGANSYTWYTNNGNTIGNSYIVINPTGTNVYTIAGANSAGCMNTITYTLAPPLPNPNLSINVNPTIRCAGNPATLYASGANSYTWFPNNQSNSTIVVNNNAITIYTLSGTNMSGCTATLIYTLSAPLPNPTISIAASSSVICAGYPNTLTASGANNYYWSPVNLSGNSIVVTPSNSTTYYVFGNSIQGCQGYTTITLNPGSQLNLSTSNYTYCTNASTNISITANSNFTNGVVSYYWLPANSVGQSIQVNPSSNSIYTISVFSPLACPNTSTLLVNVISNCCLQPTLGAITLTNIIGNYTNSSFLISNNITLSNNASFQDAELMMLPNTKIIVPNGVTLDLDHVHIYSCGIKMWKGIEIQDGGQITTSNVRKSSNLIEDAEYAIELNNISSNHSTPPIFIDNTIFNKNYIGIRISNGSTLTTLPLKISECVFTSRDLSFNSLVPFFGCNTCWPEADFNSGGLRTPISPSATLGLNPPFNLQMFPMTSQLKLPYSTHPCSQSGIQISNIGDAIGNAISPGVDIGFTFSNLNNNYNLFDNLINGFDVKDASLITMNNYFQNIRPLKLNNPNTGGNGIKHNISGLMNAQLNLSPNSNINTDGNKFWNCWNAISTDNVLVFNIQNGIFRSDRNVFTGNGPGMNGIVYKSNRFNINIENNEFNNLDNGITFIANSNNYDISGSLINGTYADNIDISQNYFGPEVSSSFPIQTNTEYFNHAISIDGSNASSWQIIGLGTIYSNKIDRAYRGIQVSNFSNYPIEIGGNSIRVSDDNILMPNSIQYGIYAKNSDDNLLINQNSIIGDGAINANNWNQNLRCVLSENNQSVSGAQSPIIMCNQVTDGYIGFEFDGPQLNTTWIGNTMFQKMHKGLSLVGNGQIGVQGSVTLGCGDIWDDNANTPPFTWLNSYPQNYETYVDGSSNANPGSFLWCAAPGNMPTSNGATNPGSSFLYGPFGSPMASLDYAKVGYDCMFINYPNIPSQRTMNNTSIQNSVKAQTILEVYPNPTDGKINIISPNENESIQIKVFDLAGKTVYSNIIQTNNHGFTFTCPNEQAFYFLELTNSKQEVFHKKIVIIK